MASYSLRLLGGVPLEVPDGPLQGYSTQPRQLALLALLAANRDGGIGRDKLLACLWPERTGKSARHSLADSVYRLRKSLGEEAVLARGSALRLNEVIIRTDVAEFGTALESGELEAACALYRGRFLDGFHLADTIEFEHWSEAESRRLDLRAQSALETLADRAQAAGDRDLAAQCLRRILALDPYNSPCEAHGGLPSPDSTELRKLVERPAAAPDPREANLFEQYLQVLRKLACHGTLLLVLDDLQWADAGSASLLFHLGRQLAGSRILVLGLCRPAEVAIGRNGARHPLDPVLNELTTLFGECRSKSVAKMIANSSTVSSTRSPMPSIPSSGVLCSDRRRVTPCTPWNCCAPSGSRGSLPATSATNGSRAPAWTGPSFRPASRRPSANAFSACRRNCCSTPGPGWCRRPSSSRSRKASRPGHNSSDFDRWAAHPGRDACSAGRGRSLRERCRARSAAARRRRRRWGCPGGFRGLISGRILTHHKPETGHHH